MLTTFALTGSQHDQLRRHLFPGDGCEAVAFALCGRRSAQKSQSLLVREIIPVPYAECSIRTPDRVTWSTASVVQILEQAERQNLSIVKIHSHPGYFPMFSITDNESDRALFSSIHSWLGDIRAHGSAVMLPDGKMFGRLVEEDARFVPFDAVRVAGDDLLFWYGSPHQEPLPEHAQRVVQTFGEDTYRRQRRLKIGVIGCSGTGSIVIEQLARNCVGELLLIDPERVEAKNLNRIPQATMADATNHAFKVDVMQRAIAAMGLGTVITVYRSTIFNPEVIRALAECDVIFGCVDSIDGRHALNRLATFYLLPYFDVGVKLVADGKGGIDTVVGTVHYLQPGGSSLLSRGVYTTERLRAAARRRTNPQSYAADRQAGYIEGTEEDRPAVISVNMLIGALAVNEFLARLHPYRILGNAPFAVHRLSISHSIYEYQADGAPCSALARHVGRGDVTPLLDNPELSKMAGVA